MKKFILFVLMERIFPERGMASSFWSPVFLPFISTYDDYGNGIENHKNLQYILQGIKEKLIEIPLGENKFHDIAVNKENLNEKLFFQAVAEGRLKIRNNVYGVKEHPECLIDFVMFRKDIVDYICEKTNFKEITDLIPDCIERFKKILKHKTYKQFKILPLFFGLSRLYDHDEQNPLQYYLRHLEDFQSRMIINYEELILSLLLEKKEKEAQEILKDILLTCFIESFMHKVRKLWIPGCYEGCQQQENKPYEVLNNAINKFLTKVDEDE